MGRDDSVFNAVERYLIQQKSRKPTAFYPSQASCEVNGKIVGKCLRFLYYQWKGVEGRPLNYRGWVSIELGKSYEQAFLATYRRMGLLKGSNWPVYAHLMGLEIRGRLDGLTKENQIIEVKTGYGKAFYNSINYAPKMEHLCQIIVYMGILGIDEVILPYGSRDETGSRIGYRLRKYEIEEKGIYLIKILYRWKQLKRYLERTMLPARDFAIGEWQCRYCSHLRVCYPQAEIDAYFDSKKPKNLDLLKEAV